MDTHVRIGNNRIFTLKQAVLVYQEGTRAFVNPTLANHALALLARLFRYGTIASHGAFVSLSSLSSFQALRIDPRYWGRLRRKLGAAVDK
jgi:hypothetical protein